MDDFMKQALEQALAAAARGEVPVGAVLVKDGSVIAADGNRVEERSDPTAHAEIQVIRAASAQLKSPRLEDCDLYVTLEPCPMCAAAIAHARLRRLYFGAYDPKGGGVEHGARVFARSTCHHHPEVVGGVSETEAAEILRDFFRQRR
ncbi:MAG: nucleoside deaminase [Magnetospirillum sp.]